MMQGTVFDYKPESEFFFKDLPVCAKKAYLWRMSIELELILSEEICAILDAGGCLECCYRPSDINERDWLKIIDLADKKLSNDKFFYEEIDVSVVIKKIMGLNKEISGDYECWDDYHKWYLASGCEVHDSEKDRFPCLVRFNDPEVLEDGWHRLHDYVRSGAKTIPMLEV